ncbi:MAG TPA: hypothetical protein V6C78_19580 [Crinalium sp.]
MGYGVWGDRSIWSLDEIVGYRRVATSGFRALTEKYWLLAPDS